MSGASCKQHEHGQFEIGQLVDNDELSQKMYSTKYRLAYLWGNSVVLDRPVGRVLPKQARDGLEQARFAAVEQTSRLKFNRLVQKECN